MASSDVVMIRDNGSNTQQYLLSPQYLCGVSAGRVRMQDSMCDKPGPSSPLMSALPLLGNHVYGAISTPSTSLDSPIQSELSTDVPTAFSEQEDEILRELVKRHGTKKWHIISAKMQKKTPRECRKRWRTYLHMCMNKSSWSAEEDHLLLQGHNAFGNRWTEIAKMVPGRTDNAVKNRYNALCTKRSHHSAKASTTSGITRHPMGESWTHKCPHRFGLHDIKRIKQVTQDNHHDKERAATVAYLKSNVIFETSCSRLGLCIDEMPHDEHDLNRMRVPRKQMTDILDHTILMEGYMPASMGNSVTSPEDGPVDMDEVMGWLLTSQTPTPTFDCSGNSMNSTLTSCTPLTSPSPNLTTAGGRQGIDADPNPFGGEPQPHLTTNEFTCCEVHSKEDQNSHWLLL